MLFWCPVRSAPCRALLFYKQLTAKPKHCLTKGTNWKCLLMPEGQFDILLEGKQAAEAPSCQFFPFFEVLHCQSTRTRPKKKQWESCGTVILCCGKGEKHVARIHSLLYYSRVGQKIYLMAMVNQQLEKRRSRTIKQGAMVPAREGWRALGLK